VDRDAIARERRRRQALEALAFEQERETALRAQIEDVVLEEDGPEVDRAAFARMEPADAELVRDLLGLDDGPDEVDGGEESEWDELLEDIEIGPDGAPEEAEPDEIARLEQEIMQSRAHQSALERYLDALEP
jgi:hypothetical protein